MPVIKSDGVVNALTISTPDTKQHIIDAVETVAEKKKRGPYKTKSPNRGGARPNSGRPKGSGNKITAATLLQAIEIVDEPFEVGFAKDYVKARMGEDKHLVAKYQQMIINKVIADKQDIDLTSNGEPMAVVLQIMGQELPDWNK
jgi:hypothetical protein